jgi:hypothetical protein
MLPIQTLTLNVTCLGDHHKLSFKMADSTNKENGVMIQELVMTPAQDRSALMKVHSAVIKFYNKESSSFSIKATIKNHQVS